MPQKYYNFNNTNDQYIDNWKLYQDQFKIPITLTPETIINLLIMNKKLKRTFWDNDAVASYEDGKFIVTIKTRNFERPLEVTELLEKDWIIIE